MPDDDPRYPPAAAPRDAGDDLLASLLPSALDESCDVCGSGETWWRNCKLLCRQCGAIVKSCADL